MENIFAQIAVWVGAVSALLTAVIGIAMLIPGDQPEKFLQSVLAVITNFSRK